MKIRLVAMLLVAGAGCASPKLGDRSLGGSQDGPDLSMGGVGSNGSSEDMAMRVPVDLAMAGDPVDLAMATVVDMAKPPAPVVDMAPPPPPPPDLGPTCKPA